MAKALFGVRCNRERPSDCQLRTSRYFDIQVNAFARLTLNTGTTVSWVAV